MCRHIGKSSRRIQNRVAINRRQSLTRRKVMSGTGPDSLVKSTNAHCCECSGEGDIWNNFFLSEPVSIGPYLLPLFEECGHMRTAHKIMSDGLTVTPSKYRAHDNISVILDLKLTPVVNVAFFF